MIILIDHVIEKILKPSKIVNRTAFFDYQPIKGVSKVKEFLEVFGPYLSAPS